MYNCKLVLEEYIEDIKSKCHLYVHSSGANIICIENEDTNRVFSLSFATKPFDNSGVFHVLEHTVLCGSKEYPVHDPFNDLDKGSMNTYLNAMTFYDKTVYPVASTNEKELFYLASVYCDAVFSPLIAEKKGIFLQEGIHFDGEKLGGVVYNEMKGVFADAEEVLEFKAKEILFENKGYAFYSGGVPEYIESLTYEKYLETYNKYYKSENCVIYIYGKLDFDKYLDFLDRKYLSKFPHGQIKELYSEKPNFAQVKEVSFEGSERCMQASYLLGESTNLKETQALDVLSSFLMDTEASPLYNALREENIGGSIEYYIDDEMYRPTFNIVIADTEEENTARFRDTVEKCFWEIYKKGIDNKLIDGEINNRIFFLKEEDFGYKPKGLFYNFEILKYFFYGKRDFDGLKFKSLFDKNYDYRSLIKKYFIDNKNCVYAIMTEKENKKTRNIKTYRKNTEELEKYRAEKDKPEDKAKLPYISVSDVSRKSESIPTEIYAAENAKIIHTPINKDIIYFAPLFPTWGVPYELKKYIGIFAYLLGKLDTKRHSAAEFDSELNYSTGGFAAEYVSYACKESFYPAVVTEGKALSSKADKLIELMCECIFETKFDHVNKICYLLRELKSRIERNIIQRGNKYAEDRTTLKYSSQMRYDEAVDGIEFYLSLGTVIEEAENYPDRFIYKLKIVRDSIVYSNNITISVTGDAAASEKAAKSYFEYRNSLPFNKYAVYLDIPYSGSYRERIYINGDTCFNAKGFEYDVKNMNFGHIRLLSKIINTDYLWRTVRGENGAYGGNCTLSRIGIGNLSSYRDNFIEKTYAAFNDIRRYVSECSFDANSFEKYKIGALGILSRPIKDCDRGNIAVARYFMGITEEIINFERESLMDANIEDIRKCAAVFNLPESSLCTIGGDKYNSKTDFFDRYIRLN